MQDNWLQDVDWNKVERRDGDGEKDEEREEKAGMMYEVAFQPGRGVTRVEVG